MDLKLDVERTALVAIDLQKGIMALQGKPYATQTVVERAGELVAAFRAAGAFVVLVNVGSRDGKDMLRPISDQAMPRREMPADYMRLAPELQVQESDHLVTKHQWGAFYGTDLDLQLRRRGIDTIVLCGISTNIGVETTAREAFQYNYQQVFAEDAMTALSEEEHNHTVKYTFPRIGRVRRTEEIVSALRL